MHKPIFKKQIKLLVQNSSFKSGVGFTLLETVLYVSVLSFILASLLGITYQSLESADKISQKITLQQEANFLVRKFEWAINGASDANISGNDLIITRYSSPMSVVFKNNLVNKTLDLSAEFGQLPLNSQNVLVDNIIFTVGATTPKQVTLSFNVNGEPFSISKYIR